MRPRPGTAGPTMPRARPYVNRVRVRCAREGPSATTARSVFMRMRRFGDDPDRSLSRLLELVHDARDRFLRVAEQHPGLRVEVELVVDAGEAGLHRALDDNDVLRLVDVEDRHAVDRARSVLARRGIRDVVRA